MVHCLLLESLVSLHVFRIQHLPILQLHNLTFSTLSPSNPLIQLYQLLRDLGLYVLLGTSALFPFKHSPRDSSFIWKNSYVICMGHPCVIHRTSRLQDIPLNISSIFWELASYSTYPITAYNATKINLLNWLPNPTFTKENLRLFISLFFTSHSYSVSKISPSPDWRISYYTVKSGKEITYYSTFYPSQYLQECPELRNFLITVCHMNLYIKLPANLL